MKVTVGLYSKADYFYRWGKFYRSFCNLVYSQSVSNLCQAWDKVENDSTVSKLAGQKLCYSLSNEPTKVKSYLVHGLSVLPCPSPRLCLLSLHPLFIPPLLNCLTYASPSQPFSPTSKPNKKDSIFDLFAFCFFKCIRFFCRSKHWVIYAVLDDHFLASLLFNPL